jgi:hypothetical protein
MRLLLSPALLIAVLLPRAAVAAPPDPCLVAPCLVAYAQNRIAIDADGNFNDPDDWPATPLTLALIARAGLQDRLVHYSYNDSLGDTANDPAMSAEMERSTLGGADQFGFDRTRFFDCQKELAAAIDNLRAEIEASSATDPLFIIAAGPMEVLWRALSAADPGETQHVTVISHSPWNDNRVSAPDMTHTATDVKALGVKWIEIADQNRRLYTGTDHAPWPHTYTGGDYKPWAWLHDATREGLRWIYDRMAVSGKPDVSDAGMAYFLLHNDPYATPDKLRLSLGDWAVPPAGSDLPVLPPCPALPPGDVQASAGRRRRAPVLLRRACSRRAREAAVRAPRPD